MRIFRQSLFLLLLIIFSPNSGHATTNTSYGERTVILTTSKTITSQFTRKKTSYIINDEYDLHGEKLTIPKDCKIIFSGGSINNGKVEFSNTLIIAETKPVFKSILEMNGTLANETIIVDWFNCTPINDESINSAVLDILVPLAFRSKSNIYFASKGEYKVLKHFPVIRNLDNSNILDCMGITIYGCGQETIIHNMGYYRDGRYHVEDVFNMVNCKNLNICDLSVTAEQRYYEPKLDKSGQPLYSGTNAFSLINYIENITIKNCKAFNMPTIWYYFPEIDYFYPDGGKGFTIQHINGDELINRGVNKVKIENCNVTNCASAFDIVINKNVSCDNVEWNNCSAKNCTYGVYVVNTTANKNADIQFSQLFVEDCQIGVYGYIPTGLIVKESSFYFHSKKMKYPEHLADFCFVQLYSAKNCSFSGNRFVKSDDIAMNNAFWLGQCGTSDIYTTNDISLLDNSFVGNFDESVIKFINPRKTTANRFKNVMTRNNKIVGTFKGSFIGKLNVLDKNSIKEE